MRRPPSKSLAPGGRRLDPRFWPAVCAGLLLALSLTTGCGERSTSAEAASSPGRTGSDSPTTPPEAPSQPVAPRTLDISFDDIKFEMEKAARFERSMLNEKIEDLSGKPIRIRGYMLPTAQQSGLTQFVLVRDNQECCFGPGAALYDCILVEMRPGQSAEYSIRPVAVEGQFGISEFIGPDGRHLAIYHLDGELVE
jgi:hypothetical protein